MVFLGFILPPKNQKIYKDDVELAVKNYKKDLINISLEKMPPIKQKELIDLMNVVNDPSKTTSSTTIDDLTKLFNSFSPSAESAKPLNIRTTESAGPSPVSTPINKTEKPLSPLEMAIKSVEVQQVKELKRPLSPEEKEDIEKRVVLQGRLSREVSPTSSPVSSPTSSTTTSDLTLTDISDIDNVEQQIEVLRQNGVPEKTLEQIVNNVNNIQKKQILKNSIKAGKDIYGAKSNAQTKLDPKNKLKLDKNGNLIFDNGTPQTDKYLPIVFKINSGIIGKGIKGKGVSTTNSEKNFGQYHLSLPALRKGNLTIYRPRSNTALISRRNMSPTMMKMVNSIKDKMKFELEDYDRLKKVEQKAIDHIINLLRMDYPPKMKRALDEENWNLKNRYEILLSEINAGNSGVMVIDEFKDVLGKLKENKVINNRKYKMIMDAIK